MEKVTYAAHGISVLAMDCRGQGGLSEDNLTVKGTTIRGHIIRGIDDPNPDNLYYRNVFLDTAQTARILMSMEEVDPARVGAFGLSQGGALTVACAALEPRVSMAVPVYPFLSDYRRAWELDITTSAYEEINYYFRFFDPHHLREDEIFNRLGYIDIQKFRGANSSQNVVGYRVIRCDLSTFNAVCRIQQSTSAQRAYGLL